MKYLISKITVLLSIGVLVLYMTGAWEKAAQAAEEGRKAEFSVSYDGVSLGAWEKDGEMFVFLPSYFKWDETELKVLDGSLFIDGEKIEKSIYLDRFNKNTPISYRMVLGNREKKGTLTFCQSSGTAAVFIDTRDGIMQEIDADKEVKAGGKIYIKDAEGNRECLALLDYIKSRGNATWHTEKKSYAFGLSEPQDLFGMGEAKNWILLSNVFDGSKIQNKMCLDLAQRIGLEYAVETEWTDLYLNGIYHGNYLLCEKIEEGNNRVELNQGYLIERDFYFDQKNGFRTREDNPFSISSPQNISQEHLDAIANHVQIIEDSIDAGDMETAGRYLDWESFILRYLLDEAVLNQDTGITSMYFYCPARGEKLYSGPAWDYDSCLGAGRMTGWMNHKVIAATDSAEYKEEGALSWYPKLYGSEWFREEVKEKYEKTVRPCLLELLREEIDVYAAKIKDSVAMDMQRWDYAGYGAGHYETFENNIRYLKFFLAKRLSFLDREWLGEENEYVEKGTGELHQVTFIKGTKKETVQVSDSTRLTETPEEMLSDGEWWYNGRDGLAFTPDLPVLEDVTFYAQTEAGLTGQCD